MKGREDQREERGRPRLFSSLLVQRTVVPQPYPASVAPGGLVETRIAGPHLQHFQLSWWWGRGGRREG